jgi:uncharacterized membrane protein YphA (DoxX/SURF4 family)
MRIAALIARLLLGLIFVVFGLNAFLQFIRWGHRQQVSPGNSSAHCFSRTTFGLWRCYKSLAGRVACESLRAAWLVLLGPVIVNILLYHLLLNPVGMGWQSW